VFSPYFLISTATCGWPNFPALVAMIIQIILKLATADCIRPLQRRFS